jgi:RNA polymerase sigma-70 factor (ECF subfamily)
MFGRLLENRPMSSDPGIADRPPSRLRVVPAVPAEPESDAALVAAVRARADGAAARLWDRYSSVVRRILRRMLGPSADVEDALQDVFLRMFRDFDSLREPSALRSFLIGITLHVATSELRKRKARSWLLLSADGVPPEPEPASDGQFVEQRQALRALYRVLDRVDAKRRAVFVLRHVEGMELTELSLVLGCSLATTKRRVAEASERVSRLAARDPNLAPYLGGIS